MSNSLHPRELPSACFVSPNQTVRYPFGRHYASIFVYLLLFVAAAFPGKSQIPPFLSGGNESRSDQSTLLPGSQSQRSSDCTAADLDDPTTDCSSEAIPRAAYSAPAALGSVPDVSQTAPDFQDNSALTTRTRQRADGNSNSPVIEKEPPTEFQRYVAAATGRMLPIYGARLFERVPSTFAPVDRTPVGPNYQIAPGDELQIVVWGRVNFSRRQAVDRSGEILVPNAGPVSVAGMNCAEASSVVKSALTHLYKDFDVSITLARLHTIQIFVLGEARRPGSYTVSSLSTLVNGIFASGGPSSRGSMRSIQLRRGDRVICDLDLYQLLLKGDKSMDATLDPGDVIFIPPSGPRVAITGSVQHQGIYEINPQATLADAILLSDGLSPLASRREVVLERMSSSAGLEEVHLKLSSADLKKTLEDGDILRVLSLVPKFQNAVTLRGNVADPGRYPWRTGMHLSDLIPAPDALITRDYWIAHNDLGGLEQGEGDPGAGSDTETTTGGEADRRKDGSIPAGQSPPVSPIANSIRQPAFEDLERHAGGDNSLAAATETDSVPPLRTFKPRYTIQPAAPDVYWDYAAITRTDKTSLETRTIAFNLGKLVLKHDGSQDLELLPGDVVTIFSKADFSLPRSRQPAQVRIEGEISMAGLYTVNRGETLRALLRHAGGVTGDAYLYGAQFTRESTRREQQKRYNDFLDQLEREINQSGASLSSRVTSPQQAATAQTSIASQRDLVEHLRKVAMNGRIVLNIRPDDRGTDSLPDIPLENGDRLFIPSRPSTVNVIGTVYEQSSFLYQDDYRTSDYLKKAGGPTRDGDRSHMFIVRADGSVVSRRNNAPLFANSFDGLPMFPGDTLVVPTYFNRSTLVRNLLDWSQILSSFGLGAAAINVLR